ncbi:MAG: porin [Gammaproteobacteria bacterium]
MKHHINKKLFATMAGLMIAAPFAAQAADGGTTLYGQARISVDSADNGAERVTRVANRDTNLGVKGFENLGNGLKAIFQFETQVDLDDGGASSGTLFSSGRSSYVGLVSEFGTVALGVIDSPHRESTDKIDVFSNSLADHNTIIGNVGNGNTGAEFNRREPNTINYWSPKFNGFQVKGQVRVDEVAGVDRNRYSVAGLYENGPWYAALAYEIHGKEGTPVDPDGKGPLPAAGTNDTAGFKFGVAYAFNEEKTRVGFIYDRISEDDADSRFDRNAYYVNLSHKLDNNVFKVGYARAEESDAAVGDDGADFYFLGLSHALSKRTEIFGLYAATNNEDNGRFGLGNSTNGNIAASAPGADLDGFSLGVTHKF